MTVAESLWSWINSANPLQFPVLEAEFLGRGEAFSFSVENAPVIASQFISGACTAQLKFAVRLRAFSASSLQRLEALERLEKLAAWLQSNLPPLDGGLQALSIAQSAPAVLENRSDDGSEIFAARFLLSYYVPTP